MTTSHAAAKPASRSTPRDHYQPRKWHESGLNGQACEDERQADNQLGRRLDWFEQRIGDIQGQVAEAGRDLKRFVLEAVAFFGVCVLLAFGLGYYLHRLSTA